MKTTNEAKMLEERMKVQSELSARINKLMQEYKGSERYYKTNRGYAMVAAKLEDAGYTSDDVELAINIHGHIQR